MVVLETGEVLLEMKMFFSSRSKTGIGGIDYHGEGFRTCELLVEDGAMSPQK